ncbi:Ilm1p PWA37_002198 [Arxiozyma heterogenica]|uniref:Ilm1p n=1 Tax=Arxiozyma heterogenica TaxID=278026 RepID=UPI002EE315BB
MAILSSFNLLFLRISLLLTLAFYCLKDVNIILNNSYFDVLTQAMNLPAIQMSRFSGQLGFFSVLFVLLAINDLIPLLEDNKQYFFSVVPVRLTVFFILTTVSYWGQDYYYLHNNVVFIYSFAEVWLNFLIYTSIREERNADIIIQKKALSEAELIN